MDYLNLPNYTTHHEDVCLVDHATTCTIIWDKKYFSNVTFAPPNVNTKLGSINPIQGFRRTTIVLPSGTKFNIDDALYFDRSKRNRFIFKDIHQNRYHIKTMNNSNIKYLYITLTVFG